MPQAVPREARPDAVADPSSHEDSDEMPRTRWRRALGRRLDVRAGRPASASAERRAERRSDNAYMLAAWPTAIGVGPTSLIAAYINYATGASLAVLGAAATTARIADVVLSPIMGVISDKTRTPFGRRKPWVLFGCLGMLAFLVYGLVLFSEPRITFSPFWYAVGLGAFLLLMTVKGVPYQAHGGEITADYDRRSRINIRQGMINVAAHLVAIGVPFLLVDPLTAPGRRAFASLLPAVWPFDVLGGWLTLEPLTGTANYGRIMILLAWITILSTPIILWRYMRYAKELPIAGGAAPKRKTVRSTELLLPLRNPVFMLFALGYFVFVAGYVGRLSIYPFIVPYATGGGYSYLFLSLVQSVSSLVATPLWTRLAGRLERGQTMLIACIVEAAGLVLIGLSIEGGGAFALVGAALVGLPGGTVGMLPFLMASDASDYSRFRHGGDTRGLHISLISMISKVSSFIATLVLTMVGALGINPSHGVSTRDVLLIQMIGLYIPAALVLLGGMIMFVFPITRRRHSTITRRLERLALIRTGIVAQPDPPV
ncbi:MFS transporter [Novosphingobium sp. BL-52-GroH]|uniref:MFS transporter n=1 Tax=Novosphingobium sp. BL-52-GroH TaxID=3349877 RepID=UPI00384E3FFF